MAAAMVCRKRSFSFEDDLESSYYPSFKKHQFSPLESQILEKTLRDSDFNVDFTANTLPETNPVQEQKIDEQNIEDVKWVDLFVQEMCSAKSIDDAKSRAASVLGARDQEKSQSTQQLKDENVILSQQNRVLKRAALIQHDRLKSLEETKKEVEKLNGMYNQCREELRVSEMNNYALKLHLSQAQIGCPSMTNSSNFPPDVY